MGNLLKLDWYFSPPIDFELKQYLLLEYLKRVEDSFLIKNLSPHLLHLEKLEDELISFKNIYENFLQKIKKKEYIFFKNEKIIGLEDNNIPEIYEVVDFSLPQIKSKIIMGYKIFEKNNQILY